MATKSGIATNPITSLVVSISPAASARSGRVETRVEVRAGIVVTLTSDGSDCYSLRRTIAADARRDRETWDILSVTPRFVVTRFRGDRERFRHWHRRGVCPIRKVGGWK